MIQKLVKKYSLITLGCLIHAIAFDWCYAPANICYGGFTGIAQILYHFLQFPTIGAMVFLMNVPLYVLGWKLLGKGILVDGLYGMTVSSFFIDLLAKIYDFQAPEYLLACIYGGVLLGAALGLIVGNGSSTGGTELLARLLKFPFPWLPVGKLLMVIDLVVIIGFTIVFNDINNALYGLIGLYISTVVMDFLLYGMDKSKVAYIISRSPDLFIKEIDKKMGRGTTIIHGAGSYTGQSQEILMCAFKQKQIVELKQLANVIDSDAFIIVCDTHDVLGNGFHFYQSNEL